MSCCPQICSNAAALRDLTDESGGRTEIVRAARDAVGPDVQVMVDAHSLFDVPLSIDVAQRLAGGQLSEGHGEELVEAGEALHLVIAAMRLDATAKGTQKDAPAPARRPDGCPPARAGRW